MCFPSCFRSAVAPCSHAIAYAFQAASGWLLAQLEHDEWQVAHEPLLNDNSPVTGELGDLVT